MIKATREAMVHTRWTRPNVEHERALTDFVATIIKPAKAQNMFLADFLKFQQKIAYFGMLNGLAQLLLKLTTPGVPDLYQGCELWDLRLVDPDNRGPVDFDRRMQMLEAIEKRANDGPQDLCKDLMADWQDGRAKLYLDLESFKSAERASRAIPGRARSFRCRSAANAPTISSLSRATKEISGR